MLLPFGTGFNPLHHEKRLTSINRLLASCCATFLTRAKPVVAYVVALTVRSLYMRLRPVCIQALHARLCSEDPELHFV